MIYLLHLGSGSVQGVSPSVKSELEGTTRLVFVDWYPHKRKTKVRYQVIGTNETLEEP